MTASTIDATILYVGGLLERETTPSTDTWRHFVSVSGRRAFKRGYTESIGLRLEPAPAIAWPD